MKKCEDVGIYKEDFSFVSQISGDDIDVFLKMYSLSHSVLNLILLIVLIPLGVFGIIHSIVSYFNNFSYITIVVFLISIFLIVITIMSYKKKYKKSKDEGEEVLINGVYVTNIKFSDVVMTSSTDSNGNTSTYYYGKINKEDGSTYEKKFSISHFNYVFETGRLFFFNDKNGVPYLCIDDTIERYDYKNKTRERINK